MKNDGSLGEESRGCSSCFEGLHISLLLINSSLKARAGSHDCSLLLMLGLLFLDQHASSTSRSSISSKQYLLFQNSKRVMQRLSLFIMMLSG